MRDSDTTREETAVALRSISILSSATQLDLIAWTHCALSELNSPACWRITCRGKLVGAQGLVSKWGTALGRVFAIDATKNTLIGDDALTGPPPT